MSRAFVTGEFDKKSDKDTLDHVLSLSPKELVDLKKWRDFYKDKYEFVGHLIGRFYQDNGEPTEYFWQIERKVQFGLKQQAEEREERSLFPPCNLEYKNKMTRFWCTNVSKTRSINDKIKIKGDKVSCESWMHFKKKNLISISFIRSDRAESIEIGPDILFRCSIKTQRRIHVSVSRRSALICPNCDSMRSVTTPRGLVSSTTMSRRTKTRTVTQYLERGRKRVNYLFFIYYSIIHKLLIHFLSRSRLTLGLVKFNFILSVTKMREILPQQKYRFMSSLCFVFFIASNRSYIV